MSSSSYHHRLTLPFRFGSVFDNDDALRRAERLHPKAFTESVSRLKGKAEMHLKLRVRDGSLRDAMAEVILPDTVGGEYLIKLREKASKDRERRTKARALSVQVHKLFNPLEEDISCKRVDSDGMLIDIAHLIDRKYVERYQNKFTTTTAMMRDCQMQLSGPWPPYHFVHRLTRGAHVPAQPAIVDPVTTAAPTAVQPVAAMV